MKLIIQKSNINTALTAVRFFFSMKKLCWQPRVTLISCCGKRRSVNKSMISWLHCAVVEVALWQTIQLSHTQFSKTWLESRRRELLTIFIMQCREQATSTVVIRACQRKIIMILYNVYLHMQHVALRQLLFWDKIKPIQYLFPNSSEKCSKNGLVSE